MQSKGENIQGQILADLDRRVFMSQDFPESGWGHGGGGVHRERVDM